MATELESSMDAAEVKEEGLARRRELTLLDAAEWLSKVNGMSIDWT